MKVCETVVSCEFDLSVYVDVDDARQPVFGVGAALDGQAEALVRWFLGNGDAQQFLGQSLRRCNWPAQLPSTGNAEINI